ncbi:MAG: FUSC family protein [Solirubrobacterales bacterium]|nr:FUSC family protein [Solirubrobacterales bacterium]
MTGLLARIFPPASGLAALQQAARMAIVAPSVFAFGQLVLGNSELALFGVFGCFAMLVFADFGGPARARLLAFLALGGAGLVLITLGTVCSQNPWVAGGAMALLAFVIIFAGVTNGYVASATNAALLAFVLAVMVPDPVSAVPDRLAGWSIAAAFSTASALLLWPNRHMGRLQASLAAACRAVAESVEALSNRDPRLLAARADAAEAAVTQARRSYAATPYRPTGLIRDAAALPRLVADLGWIKPVVVRGRAARQAGSPFPAEAREIEAATAEVLRASAATLAGEGEGPDLAHLDSVRDATGRAFGDQLMRAAARGDDHALREALEEAFRLRTLSWGAREIGVDALLAAGRDTHGAERADDPDRARALPPLRAALRGATEFARGQASMRSVWLRNSLRGAAGLGLAVLIGQLTDLQHGFWVVLGTLSVLRSNALNTGSTVLRALAGTAVGIVVAGALLVAIGGDAAAGWTILPFALLFASYAPRTISFAAGQAGFTVAILIVFDLVQPSDWQAGLVRLEDIATGCAVSLGVGLLFWPRGAAAIVRESIAAAYSQAVQYMAAAMGELLHGRGAAPVEQAARDALDAQRRLDLEIRQYLAERSTARLELDSLGILAAGVTRVRRVGEHVGARHALLRLDPAQVDSPALAEPRRALELEIESLRDWYDRLGAAVRAGTASPAPRPDPEGESRILRWVRDRDLTRGSPELPPGLAIAWMGEHIDVLRALEPGLAAAAGELGRGEGATLTRGARSGAAGSG